MTTEMQLSSSATSLRRELGETLFQELVLKTGGTCYLCEEALDLSADAVEKEHLDPRLGSTAANLYLAHGSCNSLKRDLPVDAAKRMIRFRKFCESRQHDVSFDDVLDHYVPDPKRQGARIEFEGSFAKIRFSARQEATANVMIDPATGVRFFFCEVPVRYIHNDKDVQPRRIDWSHAWAMAQDFESHPVHEPSSCRVELDQNGRGKLLQFDGQHKTAAQIIVGRDSVQVKIYVSPPLPMIRDLIISIQNRIIKLPLQAAIAISKLADVYRDHWQEVGAKTDLDFVKSYRSDRQADAKRQLFSANYKVILDDPTNRFDQFVQKQRARRGTYPLSMSNLTNLIFKELVCQEPQNIEVGTPEDLRPVEARNVVMILNQLAEELLLNGKWQFERPKGATSSREHLKAQRFFTPGAVKYWAPALRLAINNRLGSALRGPEEASRPLLRQLAPEQEQLLRDDINRLVEHPVWTDNAPNIDATLRENRPSSSEKLFTRDYPRPLHAAYIVGL